MIVSPQQSKALDAMRKETGPSTDAILAESIGCSKAQARSLFANLKKKGFLVYDLEDWS